MTTSKCKEIDQKSGSVRQGCGVKSWSQNPHQRPVLARSWSLLLDCTLILVLQPSYTVLTGRATSSVSSHYATLFACTVLASCLNYA